MVAAVVAGRSRNPRITVSIPRIQAFAFCPICHGLAFDGKFVCRLFFTYRDL
jgi:hypothetical protein